MVSKDDWRRMGQEEYLLGVELYYIKEFAPFSDTWDHEHCSFCWAKISQGEGALHSGYCTVDKRRSHWICNECFEDFKNEFQWYILQSE